MQALILFLISLWSLNMVEAAEPTQKNVILSTTTSTQDSGLLNVLVPLFEKQTGYSVKTVSVGTGQALVLAVKGDALINAPIPDAAHPCWVHRTSLGA